MKSLAYIGIGVIIGIFAVNLFQPEEKNTQNHNPPEGTIPTIDSIDNKPYVWEKVYPDYDNGSRTTIPLESIRSQSSTNNDNTSDKPVQNSKVYQGYYVEDYVTPLIRNSGLSKEIQNEVIQQAYEKYGKKRKYYDIPNRRFTDDEVRWLRKHYPDYIFKTIDHNVYSEKELFEQQMEDYNNSHR